MLKNFRWNEPILHISLIFENIASDDEIFFFSLILF